MIPVPLPEEVRQKIKESKDKTPVKSNTLANYRNFILHLESKSNLLNKDIASVLVIGTGGTLCMVKTPKGYMV